MTKSADYSAVVLSINRALWGKVSSSLRSVQVEYNDAEIDLFCFFDGQISEENIETMSVAASEVAADFSHKKVFEHCIRVDYPAPIKPVDGKRHLVFLRREILRHIAVKPIWASAIARKHRRRFRSHLLRRDWSRRMPSPNVAAEAATKGGLRPVPARCASARCRPRSSM